jgi:hypothetical protein
MKLSVEVEELKPLRRNTLRGFITITIPELRLCIHDIALHEKNASRWVGLPAKPQIDSRTGTVRRDERGKILYTPVLELLDAPTRAAFSERVVAAVLEDFPTHSNAGRQHDRTHCVC